MLRAIFYSATAAAAATAVGVSANIKFSSSILPRDIGMCAGRKVAQLLIRGEK
jgi:hypothetical protein